MSGFSNPIIGGGGALVYPSIHSPNFNVANPPASPSPSWAILKNGLAYLFGIIITGGSITGPDYIINPAGAFFYNGAPGPGNLLVSIAGVAGVDGFGNAYPAGLGTTILNLFAALFTSGAVLESDGGTGVRLLNGPLTSTAGSAANPTVITTDAWQPLGSAGATGCTQLQARYTLSPEQFCVIDISLEAAAGGSTAGTYTFANTLPAAYQAPGSGLRVYPFPFNAPITTGTQDSVIVVDEAGGPVPGRVRITIPAVAANVFFTGTAFVPLT